MKMARWISMVVLISSFMWCSNASVQPIINEISVVTRNLTSLEMSAENSKTWLGSITFQSRYTRSTMKVWGIILDMYNKVDNYHFEKMVELTIWKKTNAVRIRFYNWHNGEEDKWNKKYGGFKKTGVWADNQRTDKLGHSKETKSHEEIVYDEDWIFKYVDTFNKQNLNSQETSNNFQKFVLNFLTDLTGESETEIQRKILRVGIPRRANFSANSIMIALMVFSLWFMDVSFINLVLYSATQFLAIYCLSYSDDESFVDVALIVNLGSPFLVYYYIIYNTTRANFNKMVCLACCHAAAEFIVAPKTFINEVI
jgi:hypothetical protein